jgi:hypothetical protein
LIEHGHAICAGHDKIKQNESDLTALRGIDDLERLLARGSCPCAETQAANAFFENAALSRIVINDQYALCHEAASY